MISLLMMCLVVINVLCFYINYNIDSKFGMTASVIAMVLCLLAAIVNL